MSSNAEDLEMCKDSRRTVASVADLSSIFDTIDVPIVVVGRDCEVTRFNRAAAEALGLTPSDIGRGPGDIPALAGVQDIQPTCKQAMIGGLPSRREIRMGDRSFLLHAAPYIAFGDEVRGAVLTFTNVTVFRECLGQAIYEREYTKTILNTVISPLVVLNEDLEVQTANRAFYDWFGVSREKIQGVLLSNLGDEDWKTSGLWTSLKATVSGKSDFQTVEVERGFPGVGHRAFLLDARRVTRDGRPLVLISFRDITDRKEIERALRESDTRFRALFESMDEGYCVVEVIFDQGNRPIDYRFLETNPVFEKQTGIKDARGRLMREIAPNHEQRWFDIYGHIALTGETIRFENPAAALGRYYEVCAFRVGAPELFRVGIIFNNITKRKDLEEQGRQLLAQEEALRKEAQAAAHAKDHFLAVLSHELRTPLSPVVMAVAAMANDPDLPVALRDDVAMIRRNLDLEISLIDDLLDLNRITNGKMRLQVHPTHVHPALRQALQNTDSETSAKNLKIQLNLEAGNDMVNADPARLQQVLWNLLRNAAKFTPEGGNIVIRTENIGDRVCVQVRDTGIGIAPEFLPKIFDAFEQGDMKTTRQFGGLGLGLAICKAVMDLHGGVIRAQSDGPGTGATFTIELPATLAGKSRDFMTRAPARNGAVRHLRILLVEDHADTRNVLARLLRASSYAVKTAESVETALQLVAAEQFDVIVSDLGLPDGTGYELMKQISHRTEIMGIALSGYGMEEDQRRSREAGFVDHVVKPVDLRKLLATIERVTGGNRQDSAN
jgi:PAS domain S-box-containing protein